MLPTIRQRALILDATAVLAGMVIADRAVRDGYATRQALDGAAKASLIAAEAVLFLRLIVPVLKIAPPSTQRYWR